jgi:hypothetical protein
MLSPRSFASFASFARSFACPFVGSLVRWFVRLIAKSSHEYEGKLYCYEDYLKLLRAVCAHCHKPIIGRSITAMGKLWHPEHFMCFACKEPFAGSQFYEHGGNAYCDVHYHAQFASTCGYCNKLISGPSISFCSKDYHPEHFYCNGCEKSLAKDKPYEFENKPLCEKCYMKLPKEVRKRLETKKKAERKARTDLDKSLRKQ